MNVPSSLWPHELHFVQNKVASLEHGRARENGAGQSGCLIRRGRCIEQLRQVGVSQQGGLSVVDVYVEEGQSHGDEATKVELSKDRIWPDRVNVSDVKVF